MLEMGVFGGKYMTDCRNEFPNSWYKKAKLSTEKHDDYLNYFKIHVSKSFSGFYRGRQVVIEKDEKERKARIALILASRIV